MRTTCRLAALMLAAVSVAIPTTAAAQSRGQDSVIGSGTFSNGGRSFSIDAHSGPSGENATGTVDYSFFAGTVTCLDVRGNEATIVVSTPTFPFPVTINVVDNAGTNSPDTSFSGPTESAGPPIGPCRGTTGGVIFDEVVTGDIAVHDAPALPTSKEQCKNGGWRNYRNLFKNQGQCVAFVQRGPKRPSNGPAPGPRART